MKPRSRPAKRQQKKHLPANYWKNPENQKRMLIAIEERLALKPKERMSKIARDAGYRGTKLYRGSLGKFRLDELGKVQQTGTRGGFRVRRPEHKRLALYKRVLQSILREPFKEYSAIAAELGMTHFAIMAVIRDMQSRGTMQPNFIITQRLKLIYKADTGNLSARELASKLHIDASGVWKYRKRIKKIKEFVQKHNEPVEQVLNRYGTLVKAGLLK